MNGPLFESASEVPRSTIDISKLGSLLSVVATDTEATYRFERGELVVSPEQFCELVKYRLAVPPS
jgi:hypothetical protein